MIVDSQQCLCFQQSKKGTPETVAGNCELSTREASVGQARGADPCGRRN